MSQPTVFVLLVDWDYEGRQMLAAADSLAAAQAASAGYLELQNSQPAGDWQAEDLRPGDIFSAGAISGWRLAVSSTERLIVLQVPVTDGPAPFSIEAVVRARVGTRRVLLAVAADLPAQVPVVLDAGTRVRLAVLPAQDGDPAGSDTGVADSDRRQ